MGLHGGLNGERLSAKPAELGLMRRRRNWSGRQEYRCCQRWLEADEDWCRGKAAAARGVGGAFSRPEERRQQLQRRQGTMTCGDFSVDAAPHRAGFR